MQSYNSSLLLYVILFTPPHLRPKEAYRIDWSNKQCAILAAAVIGSFSWNAVPDVYWLAPAFWYSSLVLSVLGILLSAQQISILDLLGVPQTYRSPCSTQVEIRRYLPLFLTEVRQRRFEANSQTDEEGIGVWKPRWTMVFTWQCAIMFMSYSVCLYLAGLSIFVCTPLIRRDEWSTDGNVSLRQGSIQVVGYPERTTALLTLQKIAVIYLAVFAIAGGIFIFCSFLVYHYVDLESELDRPIETGMDDHNGPIIALQRNPLS